MSSEVVELKSDRGGAVECFEPEVHGSSCQGAETVPQPEFVNIKVEIEPMHEDESEHEESPFDLHLCASSVVKAELDEGPSQEFHVTVKQEPTDHASGDSECSADYELGAGAGAAHSDSFPAHTSTYYINENDISSLMSNLTGKYECPICLKQFVNKSNVQRHLLIHTRHKVECDVCLRQFLRVEQLDKHKRNIHSSEKTYQCTDCDKTFRSSSNLFQHKRVHLTEKPFTCEVCNRGFHIKSSMLRHQGRSRCKKPIGPLICPVCHKEFKREFLLKSHLRMHTTEKPFECANCNMSFKYKSTLIRHIQLHNNERPHSCSVCGKTFTHSGLIKPHMRKHTGEKPYICPICQKRFSHKHNMQRHMLRHNKIKHLVCEVCHKQFPKESRLKYHMRTHLVDKRPFKCEYCPKSFSHRQNIQRHYKKKHPSVVYDRPETDASIATIIWQSVLKTKMEKEKEYIIPEADWPDGELRNKIKEE